MEDDYYCDDRDDEPSDFECSECGEEPGSNEECDECRSLSADDDNDAWVRDQERKMMGIQ